MTQKTILTISYLLTVACLWGQDSSPLRVGLHPDPPFIIKIGEGRYEGLCVDLWEDIAEQLGLSYEYQEYHDIIGMVRALDFHELEISINPLTVSSTRLKMFDVSQPFFISSLGVATAHVRRSQFRMFISNFFSLDFLKIVLLLFFIIFCFGALLWMVERRHNHYQFRPGLQGLLVGLWWSAVTMTTVGYGDKAPKTSLGKSIAIIWMFTAVIIISGFTATIASTLTVNSLAAQIEKLQDLQSVDKLGAIGATGSEDFLVAHDILPDESYDGPLEGLRALARQEIDALVYDKTVLHYLISHYKLDGKVQLLPATFNKQYRSFLLPKGSPYYQDINPVLVNRIHRADWPEILRKYNLEDEE